MEDIRNSLNTIYEYIVGMLPDLLFALVIIVIGYFLAKLIERLIKRFILFLNKRANDALPDGSIDLDLKSSSRFISRTAFWIIFTIAILIGVHVLDLNVTVAIWLDKVVDYLPNIFVAVIVVFAGIIFGRFLSDLIKSAALRTGMVNGPYLGRIVRYLILFVSIIIALDQLGVDIAFLKDVIVVVLGGLLFGASLAFALGAKTSVSNVLGSYYVNKTFQVGKRIRLDDIDGVIVKISEHAVFVETEFGVTVVPSKRFHEADVTILEEQNEQ